MPDPDLKEVNVVYLKGCPRCHGDMHLDGDAYGRYLQCLQCGYLRDIAGGVAAVAAPRRIKKAA